MRAESGSRPGSLVWFDSVFPAAKSFIILKYLLENSYS